MGACALAASLALSALAPAVATAKITFGANLNRQPDNPYTCGYFGYTTCTWESINFNTGESGFPPLGKGTITKVRVKVGNVSGPMQVVVLEALRKPDPGGFYACCKAVAVSPVFTPQPNTTWRVSTNMKVKQSRTPNSAGLYVDDHLALSVFAANVPIPASTDGSASMSGWAPAWTKGEERVGPYGTTGFTILLNADWVPRN